MPEPIIIDDIPLTEIALVRGLAPRIRSPAIYEALLFISRQFARGRAARLTHVTGYHFRSTLYNACKRRWPGIRIVQYGEMIDVSPPPHGMRDA